MNLMASLSLPIRSKLALMFVGVCLVTFGLGGYVLSETSRATLEGEILARLEFQSRAVATALDGYLRLLEGRTEDFASDGFIRDSVESLQALPREERGLLAAELRAHLLGNKLGLVLAFEDLTLLGADQEILLAAREEPPADFAASLPVAALEETWSSGLIAPAQPGGVPRVAIVTPVWSRAGHARIGQLVAWVNPAVWIVDALRSGGEPASRGHVTLRLVDTTGAALDVNEDLTAPGGPRPDSELVRSGFGLKLVADATGASAVRPPVAGNFSRSFPIAANGWSARVELPGQNVRDAVAGLQARFLGFGVVLSIAACLLFFFPMRFLTRPLMDLAAAARRRAGGDVYVRVPVETDDEIGDLAASFNSMAEALAERTTRLERNARDLRARQIELGSERDRLKAVISSMRDGLVVLDADGTPVLHNGAAGPLLKQLRSEESDLRAHHRCANDEGGGAQCRVCLFSPEVGPRSCVMEIDGGVFEIHAASLAPDAQGRRGRVLVSRDVTDRISQDERQIHQERLAVLGEVAAVMAHELNNPLASISMYNQMLAAELKEQPQAAETVEVIQRNVESCKRTIRDLLNYATNTTPEVDLVDVNATLEDVASFLRPLRERSSVALELNLSADVLLVTGDEVQIRQVFVNLVVNAIQAFDGAGGEVTVSTAADDGYAVIEVADTGSGIPAEVREKIFRPFYTTKERGQGTGLGLPTARRIAEMHGGGLDLVRSGPEGTVFRVRLRLQREEDA